MVHGLTYSIATLALCFVVGVADSVESGMKYQKNPNCEPPCIDNETHVIDVMAYTESKAIHFIFPGVRSELPLSVIIVDSSNIFEHLVVNWTKFLSPNNTDFQHSISLASDGNAYGVIFYEFCAYEDINDEACITSMEMHEVCQHQLSKNLQWIIIKQEFDDQHFNITYMANASNDANDEFLPGGSISVSLLVTKEDNFGPERPALYVRGGYGIRFEIVLDRLKAEAKTRFVPILIAFTNGSLLLDEDFVDAKQPSLEDGLSSTTVYLARRKKLGNRFDRGANQLHEKETKPGYLQWKDVAYAQPSKETNSQRRVSMIQRELVRKHMASKYHWSLPYALFGDRFDQSHKADETTKVGLRLQAVTLGTPGDGFYISTNYTSWSGVLSFGEPQSVPSDDHKALKLGFGIAIPLLLLLGVVLFIAMHFRRGGRCIEASSFELFSERDRLLNSSVGHVPNLYTDPSNAPPIGDPNQPWQDSIANAK